MTAKKLKIVYVGNFHADYSTESHLAKTFEIMGHTVSRLQENETSTNEVLMMGLRSDLVMWSHTHGWKLRGRVPVKTVMAHLKRKGVPTVAYHLDLWVGLDRQKDLRTHPYWQVEHFFTVDKTMADRMNASRNMPKGYYLPAGVFEPEIRLGKVREEYMHDIIFVGSKHYHRQWPYRTKLISWLEQTYGNRFALYGKDGRGIIRGKELNDLYTSSRIVIGDTLCLNFDYPYYLSDRVFETTGRGGFIIHPYIKGLEDLFGAEELVTYDFNNFEQLMELINYYLRHDIEREKIRIKGWQRTKRDHSYTSRLETLLTELDLI